MSDYVEKWGDSIDQAVDLALKDLRASKDEVDVIVLEQPSRGFLGFNKKLAKVRVQKKRIEKDTEKTDDKRDPGEDTAEREYAEKEHIEYTVSRENTEGIEHEEPGAGLHEERDGSGESRHEKHEGRHRHREGDGDSGRRGRHRGGRRGESRSAKRHGDRYQSVDFDYNTTGSKFTVEADDTEAIAAPDAPGVKFVREIAEDMNLKITVNGHVLGDILYVSLEGEEVGNLIGKRGQTLDAVQYLTSIVQNKNSEEHYRVIVNAERYREKREHTLQRLAKKIAEKCMRSGRNQRLEPMNPYERKVIHSALQNHPMVTTRSEGVEPNRRVVIEFKRRDMDGGSPEDVKEAEENPEVLSGQTESVDE